MITPFSQRWRDRESSYRLQGAPRETIDPREFDVAILHEDSVASSFVKRHHYSGSYPAARARVGLYRRGELVGVLVASQPVHNGVLGCLPGTDASAKAELGRLVLLDEVKHNGESWFIARAFEILRREAGIAFLVSFSDDVARTDVEGREIFGGHVGTIYQATNARFVGRGRGGKVQLLPDARVFPRRAISKIRSRDQGCRYAAGVLEAYGAETLRDDEDSTAWCARWLAALTRPLRHPGNLRYLFGLDTRARRSLDRSPETPKALPYPKVLLETVRYKATRPLAA